MLLEWNASMIRSSVWGENKEFLVEIFWSRQQLTNLALAIAIQKLMPLLDLKTQFASIRNQILDAVTHTLESQHFILRLKAEVLEKEVSVVTRCKYSI